jgi:uncharacterized protein (TIGR03437 family)
MTTARASACSALLQDGRVLVAGGNSAPGVTSTVELYTPSGSFVPGPPMLQARAGAACVTLLDGRVLMAGGTDGTSALSSAEVFDPTQNTWTRVGSMTNARAGHTATLLPWGAVLIAGGESTGAVEIMGSNGQFVAAGKLSAARQSYAVAVLPNRKVLIAGGTDGNQALSSIDVYTADDNSIAPAGAMLTARRNFGAATLLDGTVLITGGYGADGSALKSTEIFDPVKGESVVGPDMGMPRAEHQSYALPNNGSVILVGGTDGASILTDTEVYPFWAGRFIQTASMNTARGGSAASLMRNGGLVVAGGRNSAGFLPGSEAYGFAMIASDKPDYHPGETANFTGTGWKPGEQVQLKAATLPLDQHNTEFTAAATADGAGRISVSGFQIDESHLGKRFLLTATGSESIAQMSFTDGATATVTPGTPSLASPQPFGTSVTFPVTVSGSSGTPAGAVTFFDGPPALNVNLGTFTLSGGAASLVTNSLSVGAHSINVVYNGDGNYNSANAAFADYQINPIDPVFTLQVTPPVPAAGEPFSVTISAQPVAGATPTAPVQLVGIAGLPAVSLNSGQAIYSNLATQAGTPAATLQVTLGAFDPVFNAGTYLNQPLNVSKAPATVSASFTPGSISYGQTLAYTATANPPLNDVLVPTGTVTFNDGTNNLTIALVNGTVTTPPVLPGSLSLSVTYSGDINFTAASNPSIAIPVSPDSTTTTVGALSNPVNLNGSDTLTATVTMSPNVGNPTGTVTIRDGGANIGCENLPLTAGNPATNSTACAPAFAAAGSHSIVATYTSNTGNISSSTSAPLALSVNKGTVTLGVTTVNPASPQSFGTSVSFSVTVSGGGTTPTGTVTFFDGPPAGNINLGTFTLSGGAASLAISSLSAGAHSINVVYNGDANYNSANAAFASYQINAIDPVFTLQVTPSVPIAGEPFSVTISAQPIAGATPTAQVQLVGIAGLPAVFLHSGQAIYSNLTTQAGTPAATLQVTLGAFDPAFNAGTYLNQPLNVSKAPATVSVSFTPGSISSGQMLAYTATVHPPSNDVLVPTGTVTFNDGTNNLTIALVNGTATTSPLLPGSLSLSVTYSGDINFTTASNPSIAIPVSPDSTTTTVGALSNPVNLNGSDTLTATVTMTPNVGNPTGTVTIRDGGANIGCENLPLTAGNPATNSTACAPAFAAAGSHSIVATYTSNMGNISSSTSAPLTLNVNKGTVILGAITANPATNPANPGASVQFTVPVAPASPAPAYAANVVQFYDNGTALGAPVSVAGGNATSAASVLSGGQHQITAIFNPRGSSDANYGTSNTAGPFLYTVNLTANGSSVSPSPLVLVYYVGANPSTVTGSLSVTADRSTTFNVTSPVPWLIVSPSSGTAPGTVTVSLNAAGLSPGIYDESLHFSFADGGQMDARVQVQVLVIQLRSTSSSLSFSAQTGSTTALSQTAAVTATSKNVAVSVSSTVTSPAGGTWLSASPQTTTTPFTVQAQVDPSGLAAGTYQGTILVTSPAATNSPLSIPVTLTVTGILPPTQTITVSSIVNGAGMRSNQGAPNTILTAFGTFPGCSSAAQVRVDGSPTDVFYSDPSQINFLLPARVAGEGSASVQISCAGLASSVVTVPVTDVSPAIFTATATGIGQAAIVNQDGSIDTPTPAGTYIQAYVTGFGVFAAPGSDGLARLVLPVTATVGGIPATVLYAGQAPGYTSGLQQIDLMIPVNAPRGTAEPLVLVIGGVSTQPSVTFTIQ